MKQHFSKYLFGAGLMMLAVPATSLAQQEKEKEKEKVRNEVEQIIITRTGDRDEKTVIEINGDNVIVNGKNAKDVKGNVTIRRNRVRDVDALVTAPRVPSAPRAYSVPRGSFNFNIDDEGMNFFREDSSRAMLGVVTAEDDKGARINSVSKESAAEKAGLKSGDIITRINDTKVEDADDVSKAVRKQKPGDKVTVTYLREGKEQKAVAELTKWKGIRVNADNLRVMVPGQVTPFGPNERFDFRDFEMSMGGSRPRLGVQVQDSEDGKGVTVKDVEEESNAAKAGIKEGDVITHFNDTAINDVNVLRRELAENRDKISAKVRLLRNGKEQTLELKMPRKLKSADL